MNASNVSFGGVISDHSTFRVEVSPRGTIVLNISDRYGSGKAHEHAMTSKGAELLIEALQRAVNGVESVVSIYAELDALEQSRLAKLNQYGASE